MNTKKESVFGERLKKTLKEKGVSVKDLAEILGYSTDAIYSYTSRGILPNTETICRICDCLECDPGYLLGFHEAKNFDTQAVCNKTGLHPEAVERLTQYHNTPGFHFSLDLISLLVMDSNLLNNLRQFFSADFVNGLNLSVYNNETGKPEERSISEKETVLLNGERIDIDILRQAALNKIEHNLFSLADRSQGKTLAETIENYKM